MPDEYTVSTPVKVMENADMVWNKKVDGFGGANTFVRCTDGTIWVCGENAGEEEKVVPYYYPEIKSNWSWEFKQINLEVLPFDE
ncbi:MAG: hypothetical protein NC086_02850 [Alistipes sp.]|nr:hypothetical protein [Alistipes sp.]